MPGTLARGRCPCQRWRARRASPRPTWSRSPSTCAAPGCCAASAGRRGYYLARPPQATTAGDVIRALEGSILPVQCVADERCEPCTLEQGCSARGIWEQVRDRLVETLDSITLADLPLHAGELHGADS